MTQSKFQRFWNICEINDLISKMSLWCTWSLTVPSPKIHWRFGKCHRNPLNVILSITTQISGISKYIGFTIQWTCTRGNAQYVGKTVKTIMVRHNGEINNHWNTFQPMWVEPFLTQDNICGQRGGRGGPLDSVLSHHGGTGEMEFEWWKEENSSQDQQSGNSFLKIKTRLHIIQLISALDLGWQVLTFSHVSSMSPVVDVCRYLPQYVIYTRQFNSLTCKVQSCSINCKVQR